MRRKILAGALLGILLISVIYILPVTASHQKNALLDTDPSEKLENKSSGKSNTCTSTASGKIG